MPISKSQSDHLFISRRSQGSILQSAAYIFRRLLQIESAIKKNQFSHIKAKKKCYSVFAGKKATCKAFDTVTSNAVTGLPTNYLVHTVKNREFVSSKYLNQYYYLNLDIVNYFRLTSCQAVPYQIPVASKYLFFFKLWLNKTIIGLRVDRNLDIKVKPILDLFQGFVIGYIVFNVIFDGLQCFIKKNLPVKYVISYAELDYVRFKMWKRSINCVDLKVFCVKYFSDIIVWSKCLKKHVKDIQRWLINFLKQRGLTIKNTLVFQGKSFKPGSYLKYLGSKLIYSNLNKFNICSLIPTNIKCMPVAVGVKILYLRYLQRSFHVLVQNCGIKIFRDKLKGQLSKKNSCLSVDKMISDLNTILINLFRHYSTSITIKKQFFLLNDSLHKLFYKYLLRKYSSLPKIYSYLKTQFEFRGSFAAKNKFLVKITGIDSLNVANPCSVPSSSTDNK